MNKEEALREVNFIKKLLDETSKEIIKSGSAFIWVGLVMYVATIIFQYFDDLIKRFLPHSDLFIGLAIFGVMAVEFAVILIIYRRTVFRLSAATLEKQIWQIWIWALMITLLVFGILIKRTAHNLTIGISSVSANNMNIALLVALAATGVLTNKTFFYKLTVCCVVLNWGLKFLPEQWQQFSPINGIVNFLLPLCGTGIYFLILRRAIVTKGISHGVE